MLGDRPTTYPSGVVATRRLGTETSETRATLLDATEQLMLDSGYAAVSSRRVAADAGGRPAWGHYDFRTMAELFTPSSASGSPLSPAALQPATEARKPTATPNRLIMI